MPRREGGEDWTPWFEPSDAPPSRPRPAPKVGIRARSQRGKFSRTWWGERWIEGLEEFGWSARLKRGRSYARSGQVFDLRVAAGRVEARVQGSRPKPYRVRIAVAPLSDAKWSHVLGRLGERADFAAHLLAGELPFETETEFTAARASLFPSREREIESDCSCPDWANPCKHIAAVHYLLAESMDRDPFVLTTLRGRPKGALFAELRPHLRRPTKVRPPPASPRPPVESTGSPEAPMDERTFWGNAAPIRTTPWPTLPAPTVPDAVLRRLGPPAFLRGRPELLDSLREVYDQVGDRVMALLAPPEPKPVRGARSAPIRASIVTNPVSQPNGAPAAPSRTPPSAGRGRSAPGPPLVPRRRGLSRPS